MVFDFIYWMKVWKTISLLNFNLIDNEIKSRRAIKEMPPLAGNWIFDYSQFIRLSIEYFLFSFSSIDQNSFFETKFSSITNEITSKCCKIVFFKRLSHPFFIPRFSFNCSVFFHFNSSFWQVKYIENLMKPNLTLNFF